MKTIKLDVKGMHCKSCAILIHDALSDHTGVKTSAVDGKKQQATISYDEQVTDEKKIIKTIEAEGYSAHVAK